MLGAAGYVRAFQKAREEDREFFRDLGGRRHDQLVVCDGSSGIRAAAEWAFPNAGIYPCSWHAMNIVDDHARLARLNTTSRAILRALRTNDQDLLWHRRHWADFEQMLDRYLAALADRADPRDNWPDNVDAANLTLMSKAMADMVVRQAFNNKIASSSSNTAVYKPKTGIASDTRAHPAK